MRVITDAKTKHFKQRQLVLSYMNRGKKAFKDILFIEKKTKRVTERKIVELHRLMKKVRN